jgi:hypothetical protein
VDVPTSHPFYSYIETAYSQGVITGYSDNTFRPYNNVTRGQLCKIVVLARDWPILTPPIPTFSDVSTDHPFYSFVETGYNHGIISGYGDGTFRPAANAIRGQISKIVYIASGPVCGTVPPSPNVLITPSNCEPVGTEFSFTASGFRPYELVSIHFTAPDGTIYAGPFQQRADANGVAGPIGFIAVPGIQTGIWRSIFLGLTSGFEAVGHFMVSPPPR